MALVIDGAPGIRHDFPNPRHVGYANDGAIPLRPNLRTGNGISGRFCAKGANRLFAAQRPRWQILRTPRNGARDIRRGQPQPPQGHFVNFDLNLRIPRALNIHFQQPKPQQVIPHPLRNHL